MLTRQLASTCVALVACGSAPPAPEQVAASATTCLERWTAVAGGGSAAEALAACRSACAAGDGESCRLEGALWRGGLDRRDTAAAARAAERGCTLGNSKACGDLAGHLTAGEGTRADPGRAFGLLEKSCADGYDIACHNLGVAHETGNTGGVSPIDLPRAYAAYTRACDLGQAEGCHRAGLFAEHGRGLPAPDPVAALGFYAKAWGKRHREGTLAAARLVIAGRARFATDTDTWEGKLLDAACLLDDQAACVELGWRAWIGRGVPANEDLAAGLAGVACPTTPAGCALAGALRGEPAAAHTFLSPRCTGGDEVACEELALVLAEGRPEDRAWAAGVAHEACGRGVIDMCGLEAELMQAERPLEALALHEKACAAKHAESCHQAGALLETDPGKALEKAGRGARGLLVGDALARYVDGCGLDHEAACAAATRLLREGWSAEDDAFATFRVQLYEHTCARGDMSACGGLALELYKGRGVQADRGRARDLGAKACEGGDAIGCLVAGVYWVQKAGDIGPDASAKEAVPRLDRGCALGNQEACAWAGVALASCRAAPCDEARAKPLLERGCKDGRAFACERLTSLQQRQKNTKAAERERAACDRGDGRACLRAADLWHELDPVDDALPKTLTERGCDLKVGAACTRRAWYESVWRSEARSPWLRRGCELDDGGGCGALADLVPEAERSTMRERACTLGDARSCGWLGSAALHGWSRPVDAALGERLLRKACELGSSWDCGTLAHAYRTGVGLPKSPALAAKFEALRCARGAALGCDKTRR